MFEYTLIPAPTRAEKHRELKTNAEKFGQTLADVMNAMAREGWEFQRSETLPAEERAGLTSKTTVMHTFLVFRRDIGLEDTAPYVLGSTGSARTDDPSAPRTPFLSASAREGMAPRLGPAE